LSMVNIFFPKSFQNIQKVLFPSPLLPSPRPRVTIDNDT
jgi:hypothetical protein